MTSGKFFFNLMKEDLRDRIWSIALAVFVFFVCLPVAFLLGFNRSGSSQSLISQTIGLSSMFLPIITVVGAIICAVNGFSYLHSRTKTDYWHSLPIRRELLFAVKYINGILIYLFAFILNMAITVGLMAADGMMSKDLLMTAYMSVLVHLSAYLLIYSLSLIAVFLTGHILVNLMGIAVFLFYGSCASLLVTYLKEEFFHTVYMSSTLNTIFGPWYISPINAYVHLVNDPTSMFFIWLMALIFSVVALLLYRRRPSEAAGTAMAFPITQPLFKLVLIVPFSLAGGMFFLSLSMTDSMAWFLFGIVLFWFASSIFAEVVYALDFRRALDHKRSSVLCLVISVCFLAVLKFDLLGYDSYLPKQKDVKSMAINFESLDNGVTTYVINNSDGYSFPDYNYVSRASYRLSHMELTGEDMANAYLFAEAGSAMAEVFDADSEDSLRLQYEGHPSLYFDVKYVLNSGREVYRSYHMYMTWEDGENPYKEALSELYLSEDYKTGCFPFLALDTEEDFFTHIVLRNNYDDDQEIFLTKEQRAEFLKVFREDLLNTTLEDSVTQKSCGALRFADNRSNFASRNGDFQIYESYTGTISLLKEYGVTLEPVPDLSKCDRLEIVAEGPYSPTPTASQAYINDSWVYTDKEQISEILSCITSTEGNASFYYLYSEKPTYRVYLCQNTSYGDAEVIGRYYLLPDEIPEFLEEDLGL